MYLNTPPTPEKEKMARRARHRTWMEGQYSDAYARTDVFYRVAQTAHLHGKEDALTQYYAVMPMFVSQYLLPRKAKLLSRGARDLTLADLQQILPTCMDVTSFFTKKKKADDEMTVAELNWRLVTGDASHTMTDPSPDEIFQWLCTQPAMLEPVRVCQVIIALCRMDYLTDAVIQLWKYCVNRKQEALARTVMGPRPLRAMRPVNLLECFESSESLQVTLLGGVCLRSREV
jgi:hypothetical protein